MRRCGGVRRVRDDIFKAIPSEERKDLHETKDGKPGNPDEQLPQLWLQHRSNENDLEQDVVDESVVDVLSLGFSQFTEEHLLC